MQVNLCKDCKHFIHLNGCQAQCARKDYVEPVHGLIKYVPCTIERDSQLGTCRYEGIHWSAKTSLWEKA